MAGRHLIAFLLIGAGAIAALPAAVEPHREMFRTSDQCMACHNGLTTASGEDVSIGASWRASMMANSARDPYWQAGVRRETIDHPEAARAIEDECASCHMPMARTEARADGKEGGVFQHLPPHNDPFAGVHADRLAHDGVSCALCHQITDKNLGTEASFTGGYVVSPPEKPVRGKAVERPVFGPFKIEKGLSTVMRSTNDFQPTEAAHVKQSELCATCHTLITKALGPKGEVIGELPEQVMFLEWKHSDYLTEEKSCQSCHMPAVEEEMPIASVLGVPRKGLARHTFVGGNFFMLGMLNKYRQELGVLAPSHEMDASVRRTIGNLQTATAKVAIEQVGLAGGRLNFDVAVQNVTGHKLPTAYPSRRVWLHTAVRDRDGRTVFESGAITPSGSIQGNDNDADAARFEPHYREIRQPDQVQIYESVMRDAGGAPTTGLLKGVGYLKDNRLLPKGFDKATAEPRIAVVGDALTDPDFRAGEDRVRYSVDVAGSGPYEVDVELRFQVIAFRWAENLRSYDSKETKRFVGYYDAMSSGSSQVLVKASTTSR
ncbi:MAG: cytochrome c family protein [Vicinamibacterales bacterium]|nr:cytochrome c family protein [Vicinamibacterales bacterium]